jgi:hypothetical protein
MRRFGDFHDVTLIVQLGSHRAPATPRPHLPANPHPDRLLATRHLSLATVFFINPYFAESVPRVKKGAGRNAKSLGPHTINHESPIANHESLITQRLSLVTHHFSRFFMQDCSRGQSCSTRESGLSADSLTAPPAPSSNSFSASRNQRTIPATSRTPPHARIVTLIFTLELISILTETLAWTRTLTLALTLIVQRPLAS